MLEAITPDVIARAQSGDQVVIGDLYERYRVSVFRYLYYRVGDVQTAEDLTSEVFLRMLRAIHNYRAQGVSFDAWIFQIARNLAIDDLRRRQRRPSLPLEEHILVEPQETDLTAERSLTSELLASALNKLNEAQRDVIVLRFVNGFPIAQVAQTLHRSEDAIKALQRRGLMALREILTDWEVHYA